MKVEMMVYFYIAICVSMIVYNCVYVFVLSHREKSLGAKTEKYAKLISEQLQLIEEGKAAEEKHKKYLCKTLERISHITAFDKALEDSFANNPHLTEKYITEIYPVFLHLARKYKNKDTLRVAYFPYILYKYDMLLRDKTGEIEETLFELLRSTNVYCRENALKAIYTAQNPRSVVKALKVIDKNKSFHHSKLITDGLLALKCDKALLKDTLFESFDAYSVKMKVSILNFFRFGAILCDDEMLALLDNEKVNREIHFSAIRYFEKFPIEAARRLVQDYAENKRGDSWEYKAIASSALKSYPDDTTFRILVNNLSDYNWHVRLNSAVSCEKLGYTYNELINVFDGNDRYAREILKYRLDSRKTEELAVKL